MYALGPDRQSNIGSGVNQQSSSYIPVRSSQCFIFQDANCLSCQFLEFPYRQVFFTELNVVDAGPGGFGDFS